VILVLDDRLISLGKLEIFLNKLEGLTMSLYFLLIHVCGATFLELVYSRVLANEVFNFFRVDIMSPTTEETSL
jgi:hypothetical protein